MKFATRNVNSVRQREPHVVKWLGKNQPDLLLLQEIKCEEPQFPLQAFTDIGYHAHVLGQKSYNGVAILSKEPVELTQRGLPGMEADPASRYIEVRTQGMTIGNLYLPNGNSGGPEGYAYKLRWMECLAAHAQSLLDAGEPCAFAGDYNVAPTDEDFAPGTLPSSDALIRPETRAAFRTMLWQGFTDGIRALQPTGKVYTFWDYQAGAWPRDRGLRIDHALLSPTLAERLISAKPDRDERDQPQPSDHVPVIFELAA